MSLLLCANSCRCRKHNRRGVCAAACRRDQALAAINESIMKQQQQELAIETEIQGYKKDILKEQVWLWQE